MKNIALSVLFASCVLVGSALGNVVYRFSGSFDNQWSAVRPDISSSDGSCTISASGTAYKSANFTLTFATAGVRRFAIYAEGSSLDYIYVYSGATFDPTNLCQPSTPRELADSGSAQYGDYDYDRTWYFTAGTYTFVLSSDEAAGSTSTGVHFAGHVTEGALTGTTATGNTWNPIYRSGDDCDVESTAYSYDVAVWTAPATGRYDVTVSFAANTSFTYVYLSAYTGDRATANPGAGGCENTAILGIAEYSSSDTASIFNIAVTAGTMYSFAVTTDADEPAGTYYALEAHPSHWKQLVEYPVAAQNFDSPDRSSFGLDCEADDSYEDLGWTSFLLNVTADSWFYLTPTQTNDMEYYLYRGDNTGTPGGIPPFTCFNPINGVYFVDAQDSMDEWYYAATGTYTLVISPYFASATIDDTWFSILFYGHGPEITGKVFPATTSGVFAAAATTGGAAATTGATATGGSGTTVNTTGSPATRTASSTTTSSASSLVASVFFVVLLAVFTF